MQQQLDSEKVSATRKVLEKIVRIDGFVAALIVARDGLVIEAAGDSNIDVEAVGAMVTAAFSAYEGIGKELDVGEVTQIMAEFKRSVIMAVAIGPDAILTVLTGPNVNLGGVRYHLRKYARELESSI